MKAILFITLLLFGTAQAAELTIEPVYGFERSYQKDPPPSRYKTEVFTGIKGSYGTERIAGELELNQGNTTYTTDTTDVKITTQNALLGLRLVPILGKYYNINMRLGARAKKVSRELTTAGVTTTETDDIQYDPYAGAGLSINIANIFSLNTGVTMIYNKNAESGEQYDTRYTLGWAIKFGSARTR